MGELDLCLREGVGGQILGIFLWCSLYFRGNGGNG